MLGEELQNDKIQDQKTPCSNCARDWTSKTGEMVFVFMAMFILFSFCFMFDILFIYLMIWMSFWTTFLPDSLSVCPFSAGTASSKMTVQRYVVFFKLSRRFVSFFYYFRTLQIHYYVMSSSLLKTKTIQIRYSTPS